MFGYEGTEMFGMDLKSLYVDPDDLATLWQELKKSGSVKRS